MKGITYRQRISLLALLAGCVMVLLLTRLFALQVVEHDVWLGRAQSLRSAWRIVRPVRGAVVDASGVVLSHDAPGFELAVMALPWKSVRHVCVYCGAVHHVDRAPEPPTRCRRCRRAGMKPQVVPDDRRDLRPVARLLKIPEAELRRRVEDHVAKVTRQVEKGLKKLKGDKREAQRAELWYDLGRRPRRLRRHVSYEVAREVALHPERNPAFVIQTSHSRVYPGGAPFVHILGRLRETAPVDIVRDDGISRKVTLQTGASGLEFHLDADMRGRHGWVEVDRTPGSKSKSMNEQPAEPGQDVQLTIDARDQALAGTVLGGEEAAFVVINSETGAVLALATSPSYAPDDYSATHAEWVAREKRYGRGKTHGSPLVERTFRSYFIPGSIMKPFTAVAALLSGDGEFSEVIRCEREFLWHGKRFSDRFRCNKLHGELDMHGALRISCNVYFQTLMVRMLDNENFPRFAEVGRRFGFGKRTGIEIQSRETRAGRWDFKSVRQPGVLITSAIGQGRIELSPAQMARAYAGLATGYLPKLHLVSRVGDRRTAPSRTHLGIPEPVLRKVRAALREVPGPHGSASDYHLARWGIACKTGTAQRTSSRSSRTLYDAWMAGFAPARGRRPPIAFAIVVLRTQQGGSHACGPRLEQFFEAFYRGAAE